MDELPPDFTAGVLVSQGAVAAHQQGVIVRCFQRLVVLLVLGDERAGLSQFTLDALLLGFESVQRKRIGEVGLGELGLLAFQLLDAFALHGNGLAAGGLAGKQPVHDNLPDLGRSLLVQADVVLPVLHGSSLDDFYGYEALGTAVLPLLPAQAVEVRVDGLGMAPAVADAQSRTAVAAEQSAFEVVGSLLGFLARVLPSRQDGLHGFEGGLVNQGLVSALVEHALVADDAEVVAVTKHVVDGVDAHRAGSELTGRLVAQATVFQFVSQLVQGVVTAVLLFAQPSEHPLKIRSLG